jgi:predicted metal-dependent phosphoesterase TrpH
MIDLHTHSNASDGDLSPAALAAAAAEKGIRAFALTDHDTAAGLAEAERAAVEHGLGFIPGVELEISPSLSVPPLIINGEFHLLGLGIRPAEALLEALHILELERDRRNRLILEKMREAGIAADYSEIEAFAGEAARPLVGRPHFGAFLINRKIVKNQEQAFTRYLGRGRPFYVPKKGLPFERAAALIHDSGGLAVLAHPMSLYAAWGRLPELLGRLKELGLDGIEAWHPTAKAGTCRRLEELGRLLGLYITAGSDFHGSARPDRKLGRTSESVKIEDRFLEDIPPLALRLAPKSDK